MTTEKKRIAAQLRALAQEYEKPHYPYARFTCNCVERECGAEVGNAYRDAFGFARRFEGQGTETNLWNCEDIEDIRIMLLCMAAALAETGDL